MEHVGDRIYQLMNEKNMSTTQFGNFLGVAQGTVSRWINERKYPSYELIVIICEKCNVSADWLILGKESK